MNLGRSLKSPYVLYVKYIIEIVILLLHVTFKHAIFSIIEGNWPNNVLNIFDAVESQTTNFRLSNSFTFGCRVFIIISALCEYVDAVMLYFSILAIKLKKSRRNQNYINFIRILLTIAISNQKYRRNYIKRTSIR
jgi:hypothetical protein